MLEKDQVITIMQERFNNFMRFNIHNKNKTTIHMIKRNKNKIFKTISNKKKRNTNFSKKAID